MKRLRLLLTTLVFSLLLAACSDQTRDALATRALTVGGTAAAEGGVIARTVAAEARATGAILAGTADVAARTLAAEAVATGQILAGTAEVIAGTAAAEAVATGRIMAGTVGAEGAVIARTVAAQALATGGAVGGTLSAEAAATAAVVGQTVAAEAAATGAANLQTAAAENVLGVGTRLAELAAQCPATFTPDSDLTRPANLTGGQLDAALSAARPGSPLIGLGETIVRAGREQGVNPYFIAAYAAWESDWGTSDLAATRNNLFRYGATAGCPTECAWSFTSPAHSVEAVTMLTKADYLTSGGRFYREPTLRGMSAGVSADPNWSAGVVGVMNYLAGLTPCDG